MKWRTNLVGALALAALAVSQASATIVVERICSGTTLEVSTWTSGEPITINPTAISPTCSQSGGAVFRVRSTNPTQESIGRIIFQGSPGTVVYVSALLVAPASVSAVNENSHFAPACVDWAGLDPGLYSMRAQGSVNGNLTGSVSATNIVRIFVGGTIEQAADITQTGATALPGC